MKLLNQSPMCPKHTRLLDEAGLLAGSKHERKLRIGGVLKGAELCYECAMLRRQRKYDKIESLAGTDHNAAEWLTRYVNRPESVYSLCFDHVRQLAGIGRDFDGPANPAWWGGQNSGRPSAVESSRKEDWIRRVDAVMSEADECADCLRGQWVDEFLDANAKLPRSSISVEDLLLEEVRLKATFPGYPAEPTPRADCRSIEEYLSKEGRRFPVSPLSETDLAVVQPIREELLHENLLQPLGEYKTRHGISDERIAIAQFAWDKANGALQYAEGLIVRESGKETPAYGRFPRLRSAWNLLNGHVVDLFATQFTSSAPAIPGATYFGVVADDLLREEFEESFYGNPVLLGSGVFPTLGTVWSLRDEPKG